MNAIRRRTFVLGSAASLGLPLLTAPGTAVAQVYPAKPVRVICPFGAGGPSDLLTRKVSQYLGSKLGQTFFVENRAGASGAIGLNTVAVSQPDGYTVGYGSFSTLVLNPILNPAFPFKPEAALQPTCFLGEQSFALVVSPTLGVSTLSQLIAKLHAEPGKYNFASPGTGLTQHVLGEVFKKNAKVDITHVPYNSDAQAFQAVVAGTVQMAFTNFAAYKGMMDRVKLVAIASTERSPLLPQVPTFEESGVHGVSTSVWHAFFTAAGTPRPIVDRIDREVQGAIASAEMREFYEKNGLDPVSMNVDAFTKRFHDDIRTWKQIIPELGIKLT